MTFSSLLKSVQAAGEDFEWYPTTLRMIEVVARRLDKTKPDTSILDIGAGDGRVLVELAGAFTGPYASTPTLYAIEKSLTLIEAQPESIIPVGTDVFEQNLTALPVTYIYCNPPYSEFESWATMVIESGHARKAFLVLPQRWKDNGSIKVALEKRGATAKVIHSDDFYDAPRRARAVVDVIEVTYPLKDDGYRNEVKDPFDVWFDQHISTFDQETADATRQPEYERERQELARIRQLNSITDMVEAYREEYERMEANYRAIFQLDYSLLRELGVNKENVRDGIKLKMAGLKAKYWTVLFERLDAITNRLSTATKAKFLEKLTGRSILAFTENNAYAVVLWAIKNANQYFDEQTIKLYRDLSTFEGVLKYKSNVRTWQANDWRYYKHSDEFKPSHYALDYRIVLEQYHGIYSGPYAWEYPGNLHKYCHEVIADVIAVLFNLGFPVHSGCLSSKDKDWIAGQWQNWYRAGDDNTILFQVKAHKNGNLHFRFMPDAIKALNVEAGRLLGWLKSPGEVVKELGYTIDEAERWYSSMKMIVPGSDGVRLMLTSGTPDTPGTHEENDEENEV